MSLKSYLGAFFRATNRVRNNIKILSKGQSDNYAILQNAHRLEKGMCIRNPRRLWGFEKAELLISLIARESRKENPDTDAVNIGLGVLVSYIRCKALQEDIQENEKLKALKDKVAKSGIKLPTSITEFGGTLHLTREDLIVENCEKLFLSRHSIRDFDETPVSIQKIEEAIELALRAPSACNRQANQVYIISADDRIRSGGSNEFNADKYLIVTGNIRAFTLNEYNDWIVSSSIFAGYLSLALHAKGIGSCVIRKGLVTESTYCKNIRKVLSIPDDEQIVIEMAIGNYMDEFDVPISHRKEARDILHVSPSL